MVNMTEWDEPNGGSIAAEDGFTSAETGGGGFGGGGGACRSCGQEGHFARECPDKPEGAGGGGCFNCGQDGHNKADCPNPRVFTGECRICKEPGHPAAECPDKKAEICRGCKKEGHRLAECPNPRALPREDVEDKTTDDAWKGLVDADKSRDLDDVRDAVQIYVKAIPDTTWLQLETSFRTNDFNTHLIAYEKDITDTYTLMDLQGNLDQKYYVGFFFSDKVQRGLMKDAWPKNAEENAERLKSAGIPIERGIPKCNNCNKLGHTSRSCPEEAIERTDRVVVKCVNCDQEGHRARDCKEPRKDRFACRNCGQSGHAAAECTEPRSAAGVECKQCSEIGHFAKDCPTKEKETCRNCGEEGHRSKECQNPRNLSIQVCRNCDETGHISKDCPKPRDYSRVKCMNCEQMGHTKIRCKEPPKAEETFEGGGDFDGGATNVGGEGDAPTPFIASGGDNEGW